MIYVVIPNINGEDLLGTCLSSLINQDYKNFKLVVVDNASMDNSKTVFDEHNGLDSCWLQQEKNLGFAGGVNVGINYAIKHGAEFVALLNNDAVADKSWLRSLKAAFEKDDEIGITASKMVTKGKIDSAGEGYSVWGGPFPTHRGEDVNIAEANTFKNVLGASGGASMYRVATLKEIGLFDEDFFAYYEDVDISFRAWLAGWKVAYVPNAVVEHKAGSTSSKIPGFTTYQHFKNLPFIMTKNLPFHSFIRVLPRFIFAYTVSYVSHVARGKFLPATKGILMGIVYFPKKIWQRWSIQSKRQIPAHQIWDMLYKGPPPGSNFESILNKMTFWRSND